MSVYKRGTTWTFHAHWTDLAGVERQAKKGGHRTKLEAERAEALHLASVVQGRYVAPSGLTVGGFLVDRWLPSRTGKLKPSTLDAYRGMVTAYVVPRIGHVPLTKLDTATLDAFYGQLLADGRAHRRPGEPAGLSPKTVRNVAGLLSKALRDAVRWQLISHSPAVQAEPPAKASPEMRCWTPAQLGAFLDHVADDRLYAVWLLAATTGARRGELLGLRWTDLDLPATGQGRMRVVTTRVRAGGAIVEVPPKTARGRRVVSLDPEVVAALRTFRKARQEEGLALGLPWNAGGLVVAHPDGVGVHPRGLTRWFYAHARVAGLPPIRLHDLRHSSVTTALAAGVPVKVVSQRIGHANITVTMSVYAHVLPGDDEAAADAIAALIRGTRS